MIDSHAHLGRPEFDSDREEVLARAAAAGVKWVVEAGTDAASSRQAIQLSRWQANVRAAVGMHPCDVREDREAEMEEIAALARESEVVAIGETGLDFHWPDNAPAAVQERFLRRHIAISRETGKPLAEAIAMEITPSLDLMQYFARQAGALLQRSRIHVGLYAWMGRASYMIYKPLGVVGIISPWNFPWATPLDEVAMALMAGNAVVLKPSELTPLTSLKIKDVFNRAGLPDGLLQVATGIDVSRYQKHPRGPKTKPPEKAAYKNGGHVSTAKLLRQRRSG